MPILNEVERKNIPRIISQYSPVVLFLFFQIVVTIWFFSAIYANFHDKPVGDHTENWKLLSVQLDRLNEHRDLESDQLGQLRKDLGVIEQNLANLMKSHNETIRTLNQIHSHSEQMTTTFHQQMEAWKNSGLDQNQYQVELRSILRQLAQKQADLTDRLDGIKAVIRRGNLLLPEIPLAPEPVKAGDNNAPEK
jgi:hypothetical protein